MKITKEELRKQNATLRETTQNLSDRINTMADQLKEATLQIASLKGERDGIRDRTEEEIRDLTEANVCLESDLASLHDALDEAKRMVKQYKEEARDAKMQAKTLQDSLDISLKTARAAACAADRSINVADQSVRTLNMLRRKYKDIIDF